MSAVPFDQLGLNSSVLRALNEQGYTMPTPIQTKAIPIVLEQRDLMATAQTGTGKTAAFALPILTLMQEQRQKAGKDHKPGLRTLILTPTRELALQIDENLRAYGRHLPFKTVTVLGGVSDRPQISALRRRPDILVATPGRLLDLMGQGHVRFDELEFLVLDEADRMLDMGFIKDVQRIIDALPARRQNLLFSATLPREIIDLASVMLDDPASVSVAADAAVADNIAQKVLYVEQRDKKDLLTEVLRGDDVVRALVFTRTKHRANRVAQQLSRKGIAADAIHSNKSQGARQRALAAFDGGRTRVLVATDIMARGIDVDGISHVINFELPNEPESYVHRIGRTARAGAAGTAVSFCNAEEVAYLEDIEKLTGDIIVPDDDHKYHSASIAALRGSGKASRPVRGNGGNGGGNGSRRNQSNGGNSRSGRSASGRSSNRSPSGSSPSDESRRRGNPRSGGRNGASSNSRNGNSNGNGNGSMSSDQSQSSSEAAARRRAEEAQTQALAAPNVVQKMFSGNTQRGATSAQTTPAEGNTQRNGKGRSGNGADKAQRSGNRRPATESNEPAIVTFGRSRRRANNRGR